jgi:hypothetical protein
MDPLTLAIVKTIATTCLKLYLGSLFGGENLVYNKAELGYAVPKWYMQPARGQMFCAFGTSTEGDEFESLDDAKRKATAQMLQHIRLSNQKIAREQVRYDRTSAKQKRLIDLFARGEGLDDFVTSHATVDKKQLVKVNKTGEMRAFVRLKLDTAPYIEYQETALQALKTKIMQQKTEDILDEMSREIENFDRSGYKTEEPTSAPPPAATDVSTAPKAPAGPDAASPATGGAVQQTADGIFDELDRETKQ